MMKTITNTQTVERMNSHADRRNQPGSFDTIGFTVVPPRRFEDLRVGEVFRKPTLKFNGYGDQVAKLYAGMDLRKFY